MTVSQNIFEQTVRKKMACRYPVYNGGFCIKCHAKKSATAGQFSGFARRISGFWLNFHSNRGKIYMWNRLLFGSRLHGSSIQTYPACLAEILPHAIAGVFYTGISKFRQYKVAFLIFLLLRYPHAESRYTIPRSDQCKKVPFCACGRRRKARYESVHTPCKTFGLFGQPSEILDRVSCIFFVYLFHTE